MSSLDKRSGAIWPLKEPLTQSDFVRLDEVNQGECTGLNWSVGGLPNAGSELALNLQAVRAHLFVSGILGATFTESNLDEELQIGGMSGTGEATAANVGTARPNFETGKRKVFSHHGFDPNRVPSRVSFLTNIEVPIDPKIVQRKVADIEGGVRDPKVWASVLDEHLKSQLRPISREALLWYSADDVINWIGIVSAPFIGGAFLGKTDFLSDFNFIFFMSSIFYAKKYLIGKLYESQVSYVRMSLPTIVGFRAPELILLRRLESKVPFILSMEEVEKLPKGPESIQE